MKLCTSVWIRENKRGFVKDGKFAGSEREGGGGGGGGAQKPADKQSVF
jgi:hypothetical protein